jgi:hypothetical protein
LSGKPIRQESGKKEFRKFRFYTFAIKTDARDSDAPAGQVFGKLD